MYRKELQKERKNKLKTGKEERKMKKEREEAQ